MTSLVNLDPIELCAQVSTKLAASHVAKDKGESDTVRRFAERVLLLPNDDARRDQWIDGLWDVIEPMRLPSAIEPASRSKAETWLLKVCMHANRAFRAHRCDGTDRRLTFGEGSRYRELLMAAFAAGALAGGDSENELRRAISLHALDGRHKDNREDKAHVSRWLTTHRNEYSSDEDRADAIIANHEVSAKRSTVRRWITEWNREMRTENRRVNAPGSV